MNFAISLDKITFSALGLSERHDLQEWIVNNPQILGEDLLIIQKEFDGFSDTSERLDLLALDEAGKLVIIENKLDDSGKNVVWQALKYVSYCATLTKSEIRDIYQRYLGTQENASDKISEFYNDQDYESIALNPPSGDQRVILVAANFRKEVTSTVLWLRDHGVDITCIKVTPYKHGEELYLDTEQILPIQDIGDYQIRLEAKRQKDSISSKEEATRHKQRYRFWESALPELRAKSSMYSNVSPTKDNWLSASGGHSGISYNCVIRMDGARVELFIRTDSKERNKSIFHALKSHAPEIENAFEYPVDWRELPEKSASCISIHFKDFGLTDEEHWCDIIAFLSDNLSRLVSVCKPLLDSITRN